MAPGVNQAGCSTVLKDVRQSRQAGFLFVSLSLALAAFASGHASIAKPKKIKASRNPAAYVAFSKPLRKQDLANHALDRLTFGPSPREVATLDRTGLKRWIEDQLHPERVPENPLLTERLAPLESVRLSIRETYLKYPSPQLIGAVARGNGQLPDDPDLRAVEPRVRMADLITREQMETLRSGKPEEKKALLANLPKDKQTDFVWALRPQQRQQLLVFSPVELRRELMHSISPQNVVAMDLTEAKILRAVYSNRQLQELLVDFWFNHFNIFLNKGADRYLAPSYERDAIRPHVFGTFRDLLLETAKSPAMLFYLDNWESVGTDNVERPIRPNARKKRGLNENYARELLELHTLGVDGGYTQRDVVDVARCFTGWTIANPRKGRVFEYNDKVHDKGQKTVLGHIIPAGGGMADGLKVIDLLANHPSTARFISLKLARRFVADDPPPSLVGRMTFTFTKTNGDLREVLRTMVTSPEFWSEGAYKAKVKSPFEMIVSSLRATDADVTSAFALSNELGKLGEPLYRKVEPTGYSSANAGWVSSSGLLERMNFSLALTQNQVPGIKIDVNSLGDGPAKDPLALCHSILGRDPSPETRSVIKKMLTDSELQTKLASDAKAGQPQLRSLVAGLTLGSPEFQRR